MKQIILILVGILSFATTDAQFKQLAAVDFQLKKGGLDRLLIGKNGSTFYVNYNKREGLYYELFSPEHKQVAAKAIDLPSYIFLEGQTPLIAYNIGDNFVVFANARKRKDFELIRIIIDGSSGEIIDQKPIARLPYIELTHSYMSARSGIASNTRYYVCKDKFSDSYAVGIIWGDNDNENERVEIIHYNQDNKELNRAYFPTPMTQWTFPAFLDIEVQGDKEVNMLISGIYRRRKVNTDFDRNDLLLCHLESRVAATISKIEYPFDTEIYGGLVRKNTVTGDLCVVTLDYLHKPETRTIRYTVLPDRNFSENITNLKWHKSRFANRAEEKFLTASVPQDLLINRSGAFTLFTEKEGYKIHENSYDGSRSFTHVKTFLGDIEITELFDSTGKEIKIRKKQIYPRFVNPLRFRNVTLEMEDNIKADVRYKHYFLLEGNNVKYVLFNEGPVAGGSKPFEDIEDGAAVYYKVNDDLSVSNRSPLFESNADPKTKYIADLTLLDYNKDLNILVAYRKNNDSGNSELVWLQPE